VTLLHADWQPTALLCKATRGHTIYLSAWLILYIVTSRGSCTSRTERTHGVWRQVMDRDNDTSNATATESCKTTKFLSFEYIFPVCNPLCLSVLFFTIRHKAHCDSSYHITSINVTRSQKTTPTRRAFYSQRRGV